MAGSARARHALAGRSPVARPGAPPARRAVRGPKRARVAAACAALAAGALLAFAAATLPAPVARSDEDVVYRWTDRSGSIRYTADRGSVPLLERGRLQRVEGGRAASDRAPPDGAAPPGAAARDRAAPPAAAAPLVPPLAEVATPEPPRGQPTAEQPATRVASLPRSSAAPPLGSGNYAIQLAAWPAASAGPDFEGLVDLPPWLRLYEVAASVGGERWMRLRLGFFASRALAESALTTISDLFPGAWIARASADEAAAARRAHVAARATLAPEERSPPPAPPPRRESSRRYAIQLEAVREGEPFTTGEVAAVASSARTYRTYRTTARLAGERWVRRRVGFFETWREARRALAEIRRSHPDAWIVRCEEGDLLAARRDQLR